jgi:tetratricopeptide (TPR) repeat protein
MSHSVLVETSRRFVAAFYGALAQAGASATRCSPASASCKDDRSAAASSASASCGCDDWFVPVLFQDRDDPQLFKETRPPADAPKTALARQDPPRQLAEANRRTGFVGRSRELLALERLLGADGGARYAVLRGQGGEGKTALAAEFARWLVRSQQMRRAAFVCVEGLEKNLAESVIDQLGGQLLKKAFSTQADCGGDLRKAEQEIARALREQQTLLLIDNMESVLLPPFIASETPEALSQEAREELKTLLALCERLLQVGETRLIFTSREALPAPFDAQRQRRELNRLDRDDAVKLVERALNADGGNAGASSDAAREEIERLVDAVHCHARTLALLAPALRDRGVEATRESLVELMAQMAQRFPVDHPNAREQSLFASVELSLRRLSPDNRERARVLGVFHGGVDLDALAVMMQCEPTDVAALAGELVETGLATPNRFNHLSLNPALCPYLRSCLDETEREALTARWVKAMGEYVSFLAQQQSQNAEVAATLTVLELPNLFALLDRVWRAADAEATIDLATSFYSLLQWAGKPRLLERVGQVRDAAEAALGDGWSHARFEATSSRIEQQLGSGQLREALAGGAQRLLQRVRDAGEQAYPAADYDLAIACWLLARVLQTSGGPEHAMPLLDEARRRFETFAKERPGAGAERMASACITEQGDCLCDLGRLDEAAVAYEENIRRAEELADDRQVAVGKSQLGTVRLKQRRYKEALKAYEDARKQFTQLEEPGSVAVSWHQTGVAYQKTGEPEAAEEAYRKSLAIKLRLGDVAGQAATLGQLGNLYDNALDRPEEAAAFYRQAAEKYVDIGDLASEGRVRSNVGATLCKLRRHAEARQEIRRAIECKAPFGHAASPWMTWAKLADIETDAGDLDAAAEARAKAIACYLAHRRDGGENHDAPGRIALAASQSLLTGDPAAAASFLQQLAAEPRAAWLLPFIRALQAITGGSRDRSLADAPELHYSMAAEILFLIEALEKAGL